MPLARPATRIGQDRRGIFIVFEGIEGSGKSTQARLLAEWLSSVGVAHILTREPGGTPTGEAIRAVLLEHDRVALRAELLLMLAARASLVQEVIEPALAGGRVVVADRFELSTLAYQAYGRGLPLEEVRRLNQFATGGLAPDVTFLLEVAWSEGEARRARVGRVPDRIERAGDGFHERVGEAYRLLAENESGIERLDGSLPTARVHEQVKRKLFRSFPETFAPGPG